MVDIEPLSPEEVTASLRPRLTIRRDPETDARAPGRDVVTFSPDAMGTPAGTFAPFEQPDSGSDTDRILADLKAKNSSAEIERRKIGDETVRGMEPLMAEKQRLYGELGRMGGGPPLQLHDMPKPEHMEYRSSLQAFGNPLTWIAIAGSLFARRPAVAAMTAAAGIMDGFQKGDMKRVELEEKNFKLQTDATINQNQVLIDEYNSVMKNKNLDINAKMAQIEGKASSIKDLTTLDQVKKGNVDWPLQNAENLAKMNIELKKQQQRHEELMQRMNVGKYGAATLSDEAAEFTARSAIKDKNVLIGLKPADRAKVTEAMTKIPGLSPEQLNDARAMWAAETRSMQSLGLREATLVSALEQAKKSAGVVIPLSDKINRTEFPSLNKIILAGKEGTGDADVVKYGIAIDTLAAEYARAKSGGNAQLTVFAYQRAREQLEKSWSQGQIRAAVGQMIIEIERLKEGTGESFPSVLETYRGGGGAKRTWTDPSSGQTYDRDELEKAAR